VVKWIRLLGHALLWSGFLCGALVAVRRTELPEDRWSTISWPAYGTALAVAAAGVVLLRSTRRSARLGSRKHATDVQEMETVLRRLREELRAWQERSEPLDVHRVHGEIDGRLSDDLARFCDLRESLIDAFGLPHYARIMTEFALAERTINRMWSASADGYVDEVAACLQKAALHFDAALGRLDDARAESREQGAKSGELRAES
jgi:hypothetical protein